MRYLRDVFTVFPDIRLLWMHRDPIKCVASVVSLVGTLFWIRSDRPLSEQAIGQLTNPAGLAGLFDNVIDLLEQGVIPRQALLNVQYLDFVRDPLRTIAELYRSLGLELSEPARHAMQAYQEQRPRESRPTHKYATGDASRVDAERKLFERYQRTFDVASEA
jgi:hypothetical protein